MKTADAAMTYQKKAHATFRHGKLGLSNEFGFQVDGSEAVDLACDVVTIIAIDDANVFNFRSDFDDRRRAFDSKLFDHCHRVSSLKKIAVGVSCSFARGGDILLGLV